ncbi:MAG: 1-deoxy-D-xylulose-5-phosphate reductoisomerase [Armatimonadota bacterium]|nr:1-deoxy-D-xylulose-5-phosphate reductoisomerase [Armatimonadota bacterium]
MKRISILGSTGSIGTQVLDVAARLQDRLQVVALAAHTNVELLAEQARRFRPQLVSIGDESKFVELQRKLLDISDVEIVAGREGWLRAATVEDADQVVMSVAGTPGLIPTLAAIDHGKEIALASKEVLVAAGEIVMRRAREKGVSIIPIDSEHSAIFQCLRGEDPGKIEKILLTASGGAFGNVPKEATRDVTPGQALAHPTWKMGKKITIDSATLVNKGLEIIEAHWLFGVEADRVEVIIHPQSIVHSMVRFADGSVIAQLGLPDMRLPIQYALLYPERVNTGLPRLDLLKVGSLTFQAPDLDKFPSLRLAYSAAAAGGTMPAVFNAADEVAVMLFLDRKIGFLDIIEVIERVMARHEPIQSPALDDILAADEWARRAALTSVQGEKIAGF